MLFNAGMILNAKFVTGVATLLSEFTGTATPSVLVSFKPHLPAFPRPRIDATYLPVPNC